MKVVLEPEEYECVDILELIVFFIFSNFFSERYNQVVQTNFVPLVYKGDTSAAPALIDGIKEIQTLLARRPGPFLLVRLLLTFSL